MVTNKGANGSESLSDENLDESTPSDEGKSPRTEKSKEQLLKEYKAEAERKVSSELEQLREQLNTLKEDKQERLEELQEKERLSKSEKEEMLTLEQQIQAIESDTRSKAWLELNKRESKRTSREEADTLDLEYAMDWLEETADREGIDFEKFKKEIFTIVKDRWVGQRATKKAKLAFKEWRNQQEISKKLEESKKNTQFAEVGGKTARPVSKKEILESAKSTGSYSELLKGIAAVQEDATTRK